MGVLDRLVVKFDVDLAALEKGFGKAERRVLGAGKKMARVGAIMTAGITLPLLALGAAAVLASSEAEEAGNKFDVVFGAAAGRASDRIDELHETIPVATADLIGMAAGLQDLLKPLGLLSAAAADMSLETLELAGDLASFNDVRVEDVLLAIRSGFVGQSEPLLRFGADVRVAAVKAKALELGLMTLGGELTNAARATAVLAIVTESNIDALGDAARTADSTANSIKFLQRSLKDTGDTIGDILIPVVLPLIQGITRLLEGFQALNPVAQDTVVVLAAMAAAAGPLVLGLGGLLALLPLLSAGLVVLGASSAALLPILGGVAGVAALLAAVGIGFLTVKRHARDAGAEVEAFKGTTEEFRVELELLLFAPEGETALERQLRKARIEMDRMHQLGPVPPPFPPTTIASLEIAADTLAALEVRADSLSDAMAGARLDLQFEQDADAAQVLVDKIGEMADELERVNEAITRQMLGGAGVSRRSARGFVGAGVDRPEVATDALGRAVGRVARDLRPLEAGAKGSGIQLGKLEGLTRSVLPQLGGFGQFISEALASFAAGGFLGLGGVVGGAIVGSLLGGGPSTEDVLRANTEAIRRNTQAIENALRGAAGGLIGAAIQGISRGISLFERQATGGGVTSINALVAALEAAGFTMAQFQALMADLNIELVGSVEGFRQVRDVLSANLFTGLAGALDLAQLRIDFGDITDPAEQFALIQSALAGALGGGISGVGATVARLDPTTIGDFAQGILEQIAAGTFNFGQLGKVSLDEFLAALGQLESLGDAADSAADALGGIASIINQPSGFKVALHRFRATSLETPLNNLPPRPEVLGKGGGMFGGGNVEITIERLIVDGDEDAGRRIVEAIKDEFERENARGGGDALNLSVVEG